MVEPPRTSTPSPGSRNRIATDLPNTTRDETLIKAGESAYVNVGARSGSNRWGDYSVALVDRERP